MRSSAFNVTARDCATGNYSFGHELGHNMGLAHDAFAGGGPGAYPYAYGYVDVPNLFRTIMAYNCSSGCPRINWWSNPAKTRNGVAMGNTRANNARVLNERATVLAGFRGAPANTGVSVSNTGDYTIPALELKPGISEGRHGLDIHLGDAECPPTSQNESAGSHV